MCTSSIDDLHMLGYWVDPGASRRPASGRSASGSTRAEEIVERLNAQGVPVSFEDAIAQAGDASSVGRPHIAKAAGVKPEGMSAFFEEWLVPGAKAFVSRRWPDARRRRSRSSTAPEAPPCSPIRSGTWTSPNEVAALIDDLDLDGVECFYPAHDRAQTKFLLEVCRDRGLAATASSDFHGPSHKMFDSFCAYPTYDLGEPELPPTTRIRRAARPGSAGAPRGRVRIFARRLLGGLVLGVEASARG